MFAQLIVYMALMIEKELELKLKRMDLIQQERCFIRTLLRAGGWPSSA